MQFGQNKSVCNEYFVPAGTIYNHCYKQMYRNGSMVHTCILHAGTKCIIFPFVVCTQCLSIPVDTLAQGLEVDEGLVAELAGEYTVKWLYISISMHAPVAYNSFRC